MTDSTSSGIGSSVRAGRDAALFKPEPVDVSHVVVSLDGSPFAERALPVAGWVAAGLGADVHLVEVVPSDEDDEATEGAIRYLDSVYRAQRAVAWDVVQHNDVARALADAVAGTADRMACLATHGRDCSAAMLGSVAAALLDQSDRPVMLVGPRAGAVTAVDAPVVVAVDGTGRDEALIPVALGWAARLARRLEIVTVARPAAEGYREDVAPGPSQGPADPEPYVAALVARCEGARVEVDSHVVYDPISVHGGLVPLLQGRAALVVLGSRHRRGVPLMVLGSHAAHIVHDAPVPALVVPCARGA